MVRGGANQRKYLAILAEGFDLLLWNVQAGKEIGYEENMPGCQFLNIQKIFSVKINQYHIIGEEVERSRRNIFRYSGRILSKDSALEGGKGMKCTFIEVKHIWGNTFGNSNVTFGQKKVGFSRPKTMATKFSHNV